MTIYQCASPPAPAGGDILKLQPKFRRTPLQPKNDSVAGNVNSITGNNFGKSISKPKREWIEISLFGGDDSNKENRPPASPMKIESLELDSSLAEELSAIRKKLERLRLDREKTDKMLQERDAMLEIQMRELLNRGQAQRLLEIEVDRLYRLNELKSYCMRISPIRSLRAKEQEKVKPINQQVKGEELDLEESVNENELQSPNSEEVNSEITSESVAEK